MKRSFSKGTGLAVAGTALVAVTYGLVRLAYGLVLPDVQADLGFGAALAGGISAGASAMYCVGAVIGFLAATRHPRSLVVLAASTAAVGAAGMAWSHDATTFGVAAVLSSTGAGAASPALVRLVARNTAPGRVPRAQAVVNAGTGPGLVGAGLLALAVLPEWRTAWFVAAACSVLAGVAVLGTDHRGRDDRTEHGRDDTSERGHADTTERGHADMTERAERPERPTGSWFVAHRRLLLAALLLGAGSAAVWNYGRSVLVDAGVDREASITAWIALGLGGAAVVVTSRWTGTMRPARLWGISVTAVVVGSLALAVVPGAVPVALVACLVFGWGYTAATGALIAWTTEIDPDRASAGTSMLFVTLVLGQALGAAAAGAVTAFALAALVGLASAPAAGPRH
ncbi:MFS transporter [Curtobacterium sp. RRHDQ66]|uniref:MFS transporter n=1 Tax=Curtobacterium guangdongense TaxID=3413380 RepID=UPI003BF436FA